jgi:hypothetical protein
MKKYLLGLFLTFALFSGVEKAEAVSWVHGYPYYEEPWCMENGQCLTSGGWITFPLLYITVNTNKTSYAPGETIQLSSYANDPHCRNDHQYYDLVATLGTQEAWLANYQWIRKDSDHASTATLVAPSTPGTHTIGLRARNYRKGPITDTYSSITITVTAPTPPPPPPAPASITASCPVIIGQPTTIQWPASVGATGYSFRLDYPGDPVPHLVQIDNGLPARTYSSSTLPLTTQYSAWVHACNATGCSPAAAQTTFTCPIPAPFADISATGCRITDGASTCSGTVNSWNIYNATNPNLFHGNGTTLSTSDAGTNLPVTLAYGTNYLAARDGGTVLRDTIVTATCDPTAPYWRDTYCDDVPPPPPPAITLSLDRELIRSGTTATLTLDLTAPYQTTCTVSGAEGAPVTITHDGTVTPTNSYTVTTRPLTSAQIITVTCTPVPAIAGTPATTAETRVSVVPTIQEI